MYKCLWVEQLYIHCGVRRTSQNFIADNNLWSMLLRGFDVHPYARRLLGSRISFHFKMFLYAIYTFKNII